MAIDDPLSEALNRLANSSQLDVGKEVIRLAASLFPLGKALDKLLNGVAQRRLIERIVEVFEEMKSQLEEVGQAQVQKEYFMSEEFQTLLTLVLQELQTTHDRAKLKMLASALSNSGQIKFQRENRKELFLRTLRTLSPQHIELLNSLMPMQLTYEEFAQSQHLLKNLVDENGHGFLDPAVGRPKGWKIGNSKAFPVIQGPRGEQLLLLQNLAGSGLVEEAIGQKRPQDSKVKKIVWGDELITSFTPGVTGIPIRCFKLSMFGEQFLNFVSRGPI